MKTHDINKLPVWAKQRIETLAGNVSYWKGKAQEVKGDKKTNTYIQNGIDAPLPLPNNARIIFVVNPDRDINTGQIQVTVKEKGEIEIYGCEQLNIKPQASNSVYIKSRRD